MKGAIAPALSVAAIGGMNVAKDGIEAMMQSRYPRQGPPDWRRLDGRRHRLGPERGLALGEALKCGIACGAATASRSGTALGSCEMLQKLLTQI